MNRKFKGILSVICEFLFCKLANFERYFVLNSEIAALFIAVGSVTKWEPYSAMYANSPPPLTCECDDTICSTSVVPDLGIPRIKIGIGPAKFYLLCSEFSSTEA